MLSRKLTNPYSKHSVTVFFSWKMIGLAFMYNERLEPEYGDYGSVLGGDWYKGFQIMLPFVLIEIERWCD